MLTRKQSELLTYIETVIATEGVSPSFEEMKDAVGLKSKSGVHRLITALEERGFIRRLQHRARAIEIVAERRDVVVGRKILSPVAETNPLAKFSNDQLYAELGRRQSGLAA